MIHPRRLACVDMTVRDPGVSLAWYGRHFGFERRYAVSGGGVVIGKDEVELCLVPLSRPDEARDACGTYTGRDIAIRMFGVEVHEDDFGRIAAEFADEADVVHVEHDRYRSCIVEDPDGHAVEIVCPRNRTARRSPYLTDPEGDVS